MTLAVVPNGTLFGDGVCARINEENDRAWKVPSKDILANGRNLDIKNPRAVDDGPGDADELLKQYQEAAAEAARIRDQLRDELRAALEGAMA